MHNHALAPQPHPDDLSRVCAVFTALSEPVRLRVVNLLSGGEQSVTQLVEALELPQSTVSRHLALLRTTRLVTARREATRVYYRLTDAHLVSLTREAFSHAQHERLGLPDHPADLPSRAHR